MARLWQDLIDLADHPYTRPGLFDSLGERVDEAEGDLKALAERTEARRALLPAELADEIGAVLRERFQYLRARTEPVHGVIRLNELEAAVEAAQWVLEMQLSVLRRAGPWSAHPDEKLAEAARGNIEYQLAFLHHYRTFQAGMARRRAELAKREKDGGEVDWEAFNVECEQKRRALLTAYQNRQLPRVRVVRDALPYVAALTQRPAPEAPAMVSPDSGRG